MKHGLLVGAYELKIDEKNRLSVPSEIRRAIVAERDGESFFVLVGANRKPWLYPDRYYEELVAQRSAELLPSEAVLDFDHLNFATAFKKEVDKQGRVAIEEKILKRTGTERVITLIGVRDHLEIWNRAEWDAFEEELDRRRAEIFLKVRATQQTNG